MMLCLSNLSFYNVIVVDVKVYSGSVEEFVIDVKMVVFGVMVVLFVKLLVSIVVLELCYDVINDYGGC